MSIILLQDLVSLRFLSTAGDWTDAPEQSIAFEDVTRAVDFVLTRRLENVRLIIKFEGSSPDVELPPVHASGPNWEFAAGR